MLFDLRGRGRRRTVQVIYLSLALLLGGGLVLFGIGGDVQGGLFDAFREDAGQDQGTEQLEKDVRAAEAATQRNPQDPAPYARLARLRYQLAATGKGFNQERNTFTASGRERLRAAERAWDRYLSLKPETPDIGTARQMIQAFTALNELDKAVDAQELVVEAREEEIEKANNGRVPRPNQPLSNLYAQYAQYAYAAGQTRKGDLAADRAVSLAPPDDRKTLRESLEGTKSQAAQQALQDAQTQPGAAPPAGATAPSGG